MTKMIGHRGRCNNLAGSALLALAIAFGCLGSAPGVAAPQAVAVDARREQAIGRIVVTNSGRYILYEWSRPYDWVPKRTSYPAVAATRPRTMIFKVMIPEEDWAPWATWAEPTSLPLLPALPGATYYLGSVSPDGEWVSIYEIDWDTGRARAGIVALGNTNPPPQTIWLDQPPDVTRLEQPPAWSSDGANLIYPVKGGLARADARSGRAQLCPDCSQPPLTANESVSPTLSAQFAAPKGTTLAGASTDGSVGVFLLDQRDRLALYFVRGGRTVTLFDNSRN